MTTGTTFRLDGAIAGLAIKAPCRVATTANITLSGTQTIDGIAVVADDRVLVKDQTTGTENGIYVASATAWTRAVDFDGNRDVVRGTLIPVYSGTGSYEVYAVSNATVVIDTTSLTFEQIDSTSALALLAASSGSSLVGFIQSGTGAVARTVQTKAREIVSVADFGGVFDGSTDDTDAFNAAIESGRYVYINPGETVVSGTIDLASANGAKVIGAGIRDTIIRVNSATADIFDLNLATYVEIGGFEIRPKAGVNRTAGCLFDFGGATFCYAHDLLIRTPYDGFRVTDSVGDGTGTRAQRNTIERVRFAESAETGWNVAFHIHHAVATTLNEIDVQQSTNLITGAAQIIVDSDVDTLVMNNVGAGRNDGGGKGLLFRDTVSTTTFAPRWVQGTNLFFEGAVDTASATNCVDITAGTSIYLTNLYTASGRTGVAISGGNDIVIGSGVDTNHGRHGIAVAGGSQIKIIGRDIKSVSAETADTYDCINVSGTVVGLDISDCDLARLGSNRFAINLGGTLTKYTVHGNRQHSSNATRNRIVDGVKGATGRIYGNNPDPTIVSITDTADTTPSVGGGQVELNIAYSGAASMTTLDDGYEGQRVTLRFTNSNATIVNASGGVPFRLRGGGNYLPTANSSLTVIYTTSGDWLEVGRSDALLISAAQVIDAVGDTILANADTVQLSNTTAGSLTLTSTPTIANGYNGQRVRLINVAADDIVIQDQGSLASSNLRLAAASITLSTRDNVLLEYNSTIGDWVQVGPLVNVT